MVGRSRAGWMIAVGLAALALPGSAAQEPLPRLPGDGPKVELGTTLHAREADSRIVLWMLGHDGSESFVATGGTPLTGVATAPNRAAIFTALSTGRGATVVRIGAGSAKKTISLDEPVLTSRAFAEALASASGAKGAAIARGLEGAELSVSLKDVPVDAAISAYSAATGARVVIGRDLLFVLPKDQALADLPSKKPAPPFSVRITGATASQAVALLEAAGVTIDGRVPCGAGASLWLDASEVRADEAMRAIRLAAGAGDEIGNGNACAPKAWRAGKSPSLAGAVPLGLVRTKKRSAVLVQSGTDTWLVTGGGKAPLDAALAAWPAPAGRIVTDEREHDAASLEKAALRATVVGPRRKAALLETADGRVVVMRAAGPFEIGDGTIAGDGRVLLSAGALTEAPAQTVRRETSEKGNQAPPKSNAPASPPPDSAVVPLSVAAASPSGDEGSAGGSVVTESDVADSDDARVPDAPQGQGAKSSPTFGQAKDVRSGGETDSLKSVERASGGKRSFALTSPNEPLWAVEPFGEKAGWLGTHTALAARYRGDSWGDTFALALEAALRERGRRAQAVGSTLTDEQIRTLVRKEALKFVIAGDVRALGVTHGKIATLVVAVKVRKESAGSMKVVDVRTHPGSLTIAGTAITEAELVELFRVTAARAADAVVDSLPHDLFAVRN